MHTVKVIAAGFVLLVACILVGRYVGSSPATGTVLGAKVFMLLWFVGAAINLWFGVARAGYSVRDELPIFFVVFLVPASVAAFVWWRAVQGP